MTHDPTEELDGLLGTAVRELLVSTDGNHPPLGLDDELLRHLDGDGEPTRKQSPTTKERYATMMKYGLAASFLAAIVGSISVFGIFGGHRTAYAQVAERLEHLESLVCRVQWVDDRWVNEVEGQLGQKVTYLAPSLHRIEDANGSIQIIDLKNNRIVILDTTRKEAVTMTGEAAGQMSTLSPVPLVEVVRNHFRTDRIADNGLQELGKRQTNGIETIGFRSEINGEVVDVWVDSTTHLPVEIRIHLVIPSRITGGAEVNRWRVMTDFEFDVDVDSSLMSTDVPDGYTQRAFPELHVDRSAASLDDLISMLSACAKINDSQFPRSLMMMNATAGTPMAILKQHANELDKTLASGSEAEQEAALKSVTEFGALLGRSSAFLFGLTKENQLRYFGGARLNDVDRPLLWYSPNADENFKVVYADLSVKDVTADKLPPEPAAMEPLEEERTPRNSIRVSTPRFELPPQAIRDYAALQAIRKQDSQSEVRHLVLCWMPEFIESPPIPTGASPFESREVPKDWKPDRNSDSSRLAFLKEFPHLKGLQLDHLYLTQRDLDIVGQCKNLERLSLSGVKILDASPHRINGQDLRKLKGLTKLIELDLSQSNFVGGLEHLNKLPALRTLYLSSFENLNDKSVAELQVLPHLETLVLAPVYFTNPEKTVTDAGLQSLQNLNALKTLYVGWHGKFTMPIERLRELLPEVDVRPPVEQH